MSGFLDMSEIMFLPVLCPFLLDTCAISIHKSQGSEFPAVGDRMYAPE